MRRFDVYKLKRGDNLGDPAFWNPRLEDIDLRLAARENDAATLEAIAQGLEALALSRLNDVFLPLITEAQTRLNSLGASFSAESSTEITMATGEIEIELSEATAENYVYTDYVALRSASAPSNQMTAQVQSFNRATKMLYLNVVHVEGSGTYDDWLIRVGTPPDLTHADRTDNPHEVTAAQVGAYTTALTDAAIAAAIAAIPGVDLSSRLAKAQNLADLTDAGAARQALGLGGLAVADSVGTGQIASSVFATIAQIRSATAGKVVQADTLFAAAAYVGLQDAATVAWDCNAGFNFSVTLTTSRTLGFPSNPKVGQSGFIDVTQPGGGGAVLGYAANITFDQGVAPTIDTSANRVTSLFYHVKSANEVRVAVAFKGVRAA